jgi:hypothetical protein
MGGRSLVLVGILVWAVSWFVSPYEGLASGSEGAGLYEGPPGWQAFRASWDMLTEGKNAGKGDAWRERVCGASGLTNAVMVLALLVFLARGNRPARWLGWLLLLGAALDASWLYLTDGKFIEGLRAGYWMWLGSFALAGIGFLSRGSATSTAPA